MKDYDNNLIFIFIFIICLTLLNIWNINIYKKHMENMEKIEKIEKQKQELDIQFNNLKNQYEEIKIDQEINGLCNELLNG